MAIQLQFPLPNGSEYFTADGRLTPFAKRLYLEAVRNDRLDEAPPEILDYVEQSPETAAEIVMMNEVEQWKKHYDEKYPAPKPQPVTLYRLGAASAAAVLIVAVGLAWWRIQPSETPALAQNNSSAQTEPKTIISNAPTPSDSPPENLKTAEQPLMADAGLSNKAFEPNEQLDYQINGSFRGAKEWKIWHAPNPAKSLKKGEELQMIASYSGNGVWILMDNKDETIEKIPFKDSLNHTFTIKKPGLYYWKLVDDDTQAMLSVGKCEIR